MLATLYAFLERHQLLRLFPQARPPTLADSPMWRDPTSDAGATPSTSFPLSLVSLRPYTFIVSIKYLIFLFSCLTSSLS